MRHITGTVVLLLRTCTLHIQSKYTTPSLLETLDFESCVGMMIAPPKYDNLLVLVGRLCAALLRSDLVRGVWDNVNETGILPGLFNGMVAVDDTHLVLRTKNSAVQYVVLVEWIAGGCVR